MRPALLVVHIAAGSACLVLAPIAMFLPKRRGPHTRVGLAYQIGLALLCVTAVGLAILRPSLWWLGLIAVATEAAALTGWRVARARRPGFQILHLRLMCGSYISCVTALLAVNVGGPVAWIGPTLVGAPLINIAVARAKRRYLGNPAPGALAHPS